MCASSGSDDSSDDIDDDDDDDDVVSGGFFRIETMERCVEELEVVAALLLCGMRTPPFGKKPLALLQT